MKIDRIIVGNAISEMPNRSPAIKWGCRLMIYISVAYFTWNFVAPALEHLLFWVYNALSGQQVQP